MEHIKGGCDQFKYSCLKCDDDSKMTMEELKIHLSKQCPYIVIPCDICSSGYIRQNHLYHHCNRSMNDIVQYFSPSKILELAHDILKGKKPKELGHNLLHNLTNKGIIEEEKGKNKYESLFEDSSGSIQDYGDIPHNAKQIKTNWENLYADEQKKPINVLRGYHEEDEDFGDSQTKPSFYFRAMVENLRKDPNGEKPWQDKKSSFFRYFTNNPDSNKTEQEEFM